MGRSNVIQVVGRVVQLALSVGGLMTGYGLRALLFGAVAGEMLVHLWTGLSIRHRYRVRAFLPARVSADAARRLLRFGGGMRAHLFLALLCTR